MENPTKIKIQSMMFKTQSDAARLFYINEQNVWLPKSQTRDFELNSDGYCYFWIPQWLVKEKGLESFVDTSWMPSLF